MPENYRKKTYLPRGVSNRRAALTWIEQHAESDSVLYFLDDDNAIDVRLLEEMRYTEKVSMFPVGLVGDYSVSAPVLNKEGHVIAFYDAWPAGRKFQVDMAGFAVNVAYLRKQVAYILRALLGRPITIIFLLEKSYRMSIVHVCVCVCVCFSFYFFSIESFMFLHIKLVADSLSKGAIVAFNLCSVEDTLLSCLRFYAVVCIVHF